MYYVSNFPFYVNITDVRNILQTIILTSLTQNLLLQVGQGLWDPSQFSGLAWSCLEANL